MSSRSQRVSALAQFQASPELRSLTRIREGGRISRATRVAGLEQLEAAVDLRALTAGGAGPLQIGIRIDPNASKRLLLKLGKIHPGLVKAVDAEVQKVAYEVEDEMSAGWPVDTGFSKSQWSTSRLGQAIYAVLNLANYSGYVKRAGASQTAAEERMPAVLPGALSRLTEAVRAVVRSVLNSPTGDA